MVDIDIFHQNEYPLGREIRCVFDVALDWRIGGLEDWRIGGLLAMPLKN